MPSAGMSTTSRNTCWNSTRSQPGRDRLLPIHGKIRNLRTGYETLFRVWMEEASDSVVPVRIEFQARSYLAPHL